MRDLLLAVLSLVALISFCRLPPVRRLLFAYLRYARWLYLEWPLRRITHRQRPDYGRIAELERETGISQPAGRIIHAPPNATPSQIAAVRQQAVRLAGGELARPAQPPPKPWQPRSGEVVCDVASGLTCPPHVYVPQSARCLICAEPGG
jgi:hypothetical protein